MRKPFDWTERKSWYFRYKDGDGRLSTVSLPGSKKEAFEKGRELLDELESRSAVPYELSVVDVIQFYNISIQFRVGLGQIDPVTVNPRCLYLKSFCVFTDCDPKALDLRPCHIHDWLLTVARGRPMQTTALTR